MKRLRHPIRAIREPFGTAGLIVAMIALVAALGGTALAAAKLNSTQKKEVEKIAKKYAGKPGAAGATGPAGAAGKDGAAGKEGPQGTAGPQGIQGIQGIQGKPGTTGFTKTLPSGETETGVWVMGPMPEGTEGFAATGVSFPIPLGAPIAAANVHTFSGTTIPTGCSGTVVGENVTHLKASPGSFCAWIQPLGTAGGATATLSVGNIEEELETGVGVSGAYLTLNGGLQELQKATGTWAVTAP